MTNRAFSTHGRGLTGSLLGTLVSLALHALLLTPVLLGTVGRAKAHHEDYGSSSRKSAANDDAAMLVTFIDEPDSAAEAGRPPDAVTSLLAAPNAFLTSVAVPDMPVPTVVVALSDSEANEDGVPQTSAGDPGRAAMFSRYVGQINARIERAWIRPRTPIESERFTCRARIVQDKNGSVQEIELQGCNGDARWQVSLVRAIQSASPLPAPPNASVFAKTLLLEFSSEPFTAGGNSEGFEPEARTAMLSTPDIPANGPATVGSALKQ